MTVIETLATGTVIAVISAVVTVQASLRRFHHEKLWERKLESYTAIVEALSRLRLHLDEEIKQQYLHKEVSAGRMKDLQSRAESARDDLARTAAHGTFVISEQAHDTLSALLDQLEASEDAESLGDHLSQRSRAVADCLAKIRTLATRDLRGQ